MRESAKKKGPVRWLRWLRNAAEFLSFVAVIVGVVFAGFEYLAHKRQDKEETVAKNREAAQKVYREVDLIFRDYVKLAVDHPDLDPYSLSRVELSHSQNANVFSTEASTNQPSLDKQIQQKLLYSFLTDVFEVAYLSYNDSNSLALPEVRQIYTNQWAGWEAYIKKFLDRPAYLNTWNEIGNEYDMDFSNHMQSLIIEIQSKPRAKMSQ